jgi:hypothetical protein
MGVPMLGEVGGLTKKTTQRSPPPFGKAFGFVRDYPEVRDNPEGRDAPKHKECNAA